jgi:predicted acyltransferase
MPTEPSVPERPTAAPLSASARLVSLDAYRGFIMLAMASAGLGLSEVAKKIPSDSSWAPFWQVLGYQADHVKWTGCSFWDLIQPSFMFMVGVAMPFSYASRRAKGESRGRITVHVFVRSIVLILLGIFLSSNWSAHTEFTFVNVLTQIGLGYWFVFLLLNARAWIQLLTVGAVLGVYWYLFAAHPLPPRNTDWKKLGVSEAERFPDPRAGQEEPEQPRRPRSRGAAPGRESAPAPEQKAPRNDYFGAAAHWDKGLNFAAEVDVIFLSLFPNAKPINTGGYTTLNFVPSIATMIFGLMAGEWLRRSVTARRKFFVLVLAGCVCLLTGMVIDHTIWPDWLAEGVSKIADSVGLGSAPFFDRGWTLCPIVKRIWTPSWAIFSAGWTFLMLAGFYWIIDLKGYRAWSFPLIVVGMNSIAVYCMAQLMKPWIRDTLKRHLGQHIFEGTYGPIVQNASVVFVIWLIALWMYRRKIFVRI